MIRLILISLFLFLLSACSTAKPPITEYKIALKTLPSTNISGACKDRSLKVSQAFSSNSLMSLQMNYVQGDKKIYAYTQARWNSSPNHEITSHIVKVLRDSQLFKNTQNPKSRGKSDLILEINIEDFMQYYNSDLSESYSKVMISLTLIDAKNSEVLTTKTFGAIKHTPTLDASGGVKGLDSALEDVLEQGLEFLNEVCQ